MERTLTVLFFGRPGSGKGTQMKLLLDSLEQESQSVTPFEWAPLIRSFIEGDSKIQKRARDLIEKGERLPIFLAPSLWLPAFEQTTGDEHLLVDGVPRHRIEAELFDSLLHFYQRDPVHVIHLEVPEQTAKARLIERGKEEERLDDLTEASIQRRMEWFLSDTLPLLDFFNQKPCYRITSIDGTDSREAIAEAILQAVTR